MREMWEWERILSLSSVNTTTGILTAVAGSPFSVAPGTQQQQATVVTIVGLNPIRQFVYLAKAGSSNVSGNVFPLVPCVSSEGFYDKLSWIMWRS